MKAKTNAVYENGVFRPIAPLPLVEGETVELTVVRQPPIAPLTEEGATRLLREAKTVQEMWAALAATAYLDEEDGYDVVDEMDKYRRQTGQRPLIPRPGDEGWE